MARGRIPKCVDPTAGHPVVWVMQGRTEHQAYLLETNEENGWKKIRWASTSAVAWIEPDVAVRADGGGRGSRRRRAAPENFEPKEDPRRGVKKANTTTTARSGRSVKIKERDYTEADSEEEEEEEFEMPVTSFNKKDRKKGRKKKAAVMPDDIAEEEEWEDNPEDIREEEELQRRESSSSKARAKLEKKYQFKKKRGRGRPRKNKEPVSGKRKRASSTSMGEEDSDYDEGDFFGEEPIVSSKPSKRSKRARKEVERMNDEELDRIVEEASEIIVEEPPTSDKKKKKKKDLESNNNDRKLASSSRKEEKKGAEAAASVQMLSEYKQGTRVAKKSPNAGWISGKVKSASDNYCTVLWESGKSDLLPKAAMTKMVYDADTTLYPIKTKVKKRLANSVVRGRVHALDNSLYHVKYNDGTFDVVGTSEMDELVKARNRRPQEEAPSSEESNVMNAKQPAGQSTEPEASLPREEIPASMAMEVEDPKTKSEDETESSERQEMPDPSPAAQLKKMKQVNLEDEAASKKSNRDPPVDPPEIPFEKPTTQSAISNDVAAEKPSLPLDLDEKPSASVAADKGPVSDTMDKEASKESQPTTAEDSTTNDNKSSSAESMGLSRAAEETKKAPTSSKVVDNLSPAAEETENAPTSSKVVNDSPREQADEVAARRDVIDEVLTTVKLPPPALSSTEAKEEGAAAEKIDADPKQSECVPRVLSSAGETSITETTRDLQQGGAEDGTDTPSAVEQMAAKDEDKGMQKCEVRIERKKELDSIVTETTTAIEQSNEAQQKSTESADKPQQSSTGDRDMKENYSASSTKLMDVDEPLDEASKVKTVENDSADAEKKDEATRVSEGLQDSEMKDLAAKLQAPQQKGGGSPTTQKLSDAVIGPVEKKVLSQESSGEQDGGELKDASETGGSGPNAHNNKQLDSSKTAKVEDAATVARSKNQAADSAAEKSTPSNSSLQATVKDVAGKGATSQPNDVSAIQSEKASTKSRNGAPDKSSAKDVARFQRIIFGKKKEGVSPERGGKRPTLPIASKSKRKLPSEATKSKRPRIDSTSTAPKVKAPSSPSKSKPGKAPKVKAPSSPSKTKPATTSKQDQKVRKKCADPPGFSKTVPPKGRPDANPSVAPVEERAKITTKAKYVMPFPVPTTLNALEKARNARRSVAPVPTVKRTSKTKKPVQPKPAVSVRRTTLDPMSQSKPLVPIARRGAKSSSLPNVIPASTQPPATTKAAVPAVGMVPAPATGNSRKRSSQTPGLGFKPSTAEELRARLLGRPQPPMPFPAAANAPKGPKGALPAGAVPIQFSNIMAAQMGASVPQFANTLFQPFGFNGPNQMPWGPAGQMNQATQMKQQNGGARKQQGPASHINQPSNTNQATGQRSAPATLSDRPRGGKGQAPSRNPSAAPRGADPSMYLAMARHQQMLQNQQMSQRPGAAGGNNNYSTAQLVAAAHLGLIPPPQQRGAAAAGRNPAPSLASYIAQNRPRNQGGEDPPGNSLSKRNH